MKKLYLLFLSGIPYLLIAQFAVVSTDPVNNAKNVPLTATISITFNEAIDTLFASGNEAWFSNIDSVVSNTFSADGKTASSTVVLQPSTSYFFAFIHMKAKSGATITTPHVYYFTTGTDFSPYSISGTVGSGSTGVSAQDAIVGLMMTSLDQNEGEGPPQFAGWANVNSDGTFIIPHVSNGTYWILSAKDVNHDGNINPEDGDVIAFSEDSVVVNNASVTNVTLSFVTFEPKILSEVISIADSLSNSLPVDKQLKRVSGWRVDTLGRGNSWEFIYSTNGNTIGYGITVESFGSKTYVIDQGYFDWIKNLRSLSNINTAASSATVIANVEAAGGKAVRMQSHSPSLECKIEVSLADQNMSQYGHLVPDQNLFYWGVTYAWGYETDTQYVEIEGQRFLCNFTTGAVIASSTLSVQPQGMTPSSFALFQNYPNPFNPTTTIGFTLQNSGHTTLKVYDVLGREVATLVNGHREAGIYHESVFTASNSASGIYFVRLESNGTVQLKKMLLMK
ncbi:MAG: T9SS type A sorting domain-containing protein [Ignavibacteriales bacterium]|nr:T9SS type A sorting domain-containing protein [Ignavibacteriales bacterium]